jgi:hypothetical protein
LVANVSRPEVHATIRTEKVVDTDSIVIEGLVFEPNDGLTIQVIYAGDYAAEIDFSGSCLGASSPLVLSADQVKEPSPSYWMGNLTTVVIIALPIALLSGITSYVSSYKGRGSLYVNVIYFAALGLLVLYSVAKIAGSTMRRMRVPTSLTK